MIDSVASRPSLKEVGTRYDHYMELKEIFLLGIDVIDRMSSMHRSDADKRTKVKLENAVEVINKRLNYLSNFVEETDGYSKLARDIRAAGIHKTPPQLLLTTGVPDEKQQAKDLSNPGYPENPST